GALRASLPRRAPPAASPGASKQAAATPGNRASTRSKRGPRRPRAPGSGKRPTRGIQYGLPGNKAAPRGSTIAPYATSGLDLERYPQDTPEARFLPPPWYAEQKAAPAAEQKASRATEQKALSVRPGAAPNSASWSSRVRSPALASAAASSAPRMPK